MHEQNETYLVICEAQVRFSVRESFKWMVLREPGPFPDLKLKIKCNKIKTVHKIR